MSLFSHNKCGKITVKHWELDLFFILHFTYLGAVRTHPMHPLPTGLGLNYYYMYYCTRLAASFPGQPG